MLVIPYSFQSKDHIQNDTASPSNDDETEDLDSSNSDDHQSDEKSSSDCEWEESWNGVLPEMLSRDRECPAAS